MRGIEFGVYEKPFRGTIDSEDLTDNFRDIHNDLSEAFRREQYINSILNAYISDLSYQHQELSNRINGLNDLLVAASGHYSSAGGNLLYWNGYSSIADGTSRQDLSTGNVTLPWSMSWTKLPLVANEYGVYELASAARIAYDDGTEVYIEKPDDIYDAFDNNPSTNWVRTYPVASSPPAVTVRVELPPSTNPAINSIYISPFPECGPTVTDLRYLTSDGLWNQVANFASTNRSNRFHFSRVDYANQVDITLTPTTLLDSDGNQVSVFGIQDADVALIEYVDTSSFTLRLDAPASVNNLTYVYLNYTISPSVNESNMSDTDRPVVLEIYEDAGLTTRIYSNLLYDHPYNGSLALGTPSSSIWARVTLRQINLTTPVVRELTIRYN